MINKKIEAVLFDMDGIIVDSMPYHFISWFEAMIKYDIRVTPWDIFSMEGAKWNEVIEFAFKRDKKELREEISVKISEERKVLFSKYFKRHIFSEITDIIKNVKGQGLKAGLVTGSSMIEAQNMLPKEIYDLFDTRIAGDMIERSKPYPDPYLLAAKNLNVKPEHCLVIENAPYGIESAKAANMYCVAVETSLPKEFLHKADKVFKDHKELERFLKND